MSAQRIAIEDIRDAQEKIRDCAIRTPTVALNYKSDSHPNVKIYMKLENLQPIGSFKLRGASNAILSLPREKLKDGVYTASAGNFAQGLSWSARELGVSCQAVVPEHAPKTKLEAIKRLGGKTTKVPFDEWWDVIQKHYHDDMEGTFLHPVSDKTVMAGNGTIGLEILEDCPSVDAVIIPFGGGGLSCGIASAIKSLKPDTKIYACEVDTAAPLAAAFAAGEITPFDYKPSFVDGMGSKCVLKEMWPLVRQLIDDSIVVTLQEIADAIKLIAERNHVIAEGLLGPLLQQLYLGRLGGEHCMCDIRGNIDTDQLVQILQGCIPGQ